MGPYFGQNIENIEKNGRTWRGGPPKKEKCGAAVLAKKAGNAVSYIVCISLKIFPYILKVSLYILRNFLEKSPRLVLDLFKVLYPIFLQSSFKFL